MGFDERDEIFPFYKQFLDLLLQLCDLGIFLLPFYLLLFSIVLMFVVETVVVSGQFLQLLGLLLVG